MSNFISYYKLLNEREQFRRAGGRYSDDFNKYDTPGHKYFKLFFYFNNGDVDNQLGISAGNGLLTPTWLQDPSYLTEQYLYMYNSAWSYLKMNAEDERADMLVDFVNTLSNISSESPWYFSEVTGLEAAMERKQVNADNFTIENTRQKISIKCLPDAYDDRIGTLLDLYRAITWSWLTKREVLPANLRKFDMGIFIYETPNEPFHVRHSPNIPTSDTYSGIGGTAQHNRTSYKYIELHNCEIDYSSSKSLTTTLNNKDGFNPEYTIDIFFDDCYEMRYNEFMLKEIGDMILFDLDEDNEYVYQQGVSNQQKATEFIYPNEFTLPILTGKPEDENLKELVTTGSQNNGQGVTDTMVAGGNVYDNGLIGGKSRLPDYPKPPAKQRGGFLTNAVDQLLQTGADFLTSIYKKAILGNLYTFSLTRIGDQMASLAKGDIWSTARNTAEYIRDAKQRKENQLNNLKLFNNDKVLVTSEGPIGTMTGNTPDGPVSPMTGVSLTPDNINSNFTLVNEIGNIKDEVNSHYTDTNANKIGTTMRQKRIIPKVKQIGKLYKGNTIADNL